MLISRNALSIAKVAAADADDPTRGLNVLHVEPDGRVVATNGHLLIVATDRRREPSEDFPSAGLPELAAELPAAVDIPVSVVDRLIKTIPKKQTIPVLGFVNVGVNGDGKQAYAVATDLEYPTIAKLEQPARRFPDWERVLPKTEDQEIVKLLISADMLADLAKMAATCRAHKHAIGAVTFEIPIGEPEILSAVRFTCGQGSDVDVHGVLMPCRG